MDLKTLIIFKDYKKDYINLFHNLIPILLKYNLNKLQTMQLEWHFIIFSKTTII